MNAKYHISYIWTLLLVALTALLAACTKDDVITQDQPPVIRWANQTGVFTAKVGQSLRIEPIVANAAGANFSWYYSDAPAMVLSTSGVLEMSWSETGTYYITLKVTTPAGTDASDIRVDVVDAAPPTISLAVPDGGYTLLCDTPLELKPRFQNDDVEGFEATWLVDDVEVSKADAFIFRQSTPGIYNICVRARNVDGEATLRFKVNVVASLPRSIEFQPVSQFYGSTKRYTFPGRPICLEPVAENISADAVWQWTVNGSVVNGSGSMLTFTPSQAGTYNVTATVEGVTASVTVECVNATEASRRRVATASSHASTTDVMEYLPAPGQFIGDATAVGGMPSGLSTHPQACQWASQRLASSLPVSLGAWGGYIVVRFDHSVPVGEAQYDLAIMGNAFLTNNEPGIVWVSQDVNGNGLPDDEWYQLAGSDYALPTTLQCHAVTYFRPGGTGMGVEWVDGLGATGYVDYIYSQHSQSSYYPEWVTATSYTLRGVRLAPRSVMNAVTGMWDNPPFGWGYADNLGSDLLERGDSADGTGQTNGLRVANAVMANGQQIALQYVDFVKVQTGVMWQSGVLGEVSTEVCGFKDFSLSK